MTFQNIQKQNSGKIRFTAAIFAMVGFMVATSAQAKEEKDSQQNSTDIQNSSDKDVAKQPSHERCDNCTKRYRLGTFYMSGGVAFLDMDALNNRLLRSGYSKWDSPSVPMGLGFFMRTGRLVAGGEMNKLLSSSFEAQRDDFRMDVKSWYWSLNYGYDVVQWKGLSVYPLLSIGASHTDIWLSKEEGTSFNEALVSPGQGTHMRQDSLILKAELGIDYRFELKERATKTTYFSFGLRGGYLFSAYNSNWSTASAEVHNGPSRGLNGPVVQLMLGFSRQRHK